MNKLKKEYKQKLYELVPKKFSVLEEDLWNFIESTISQTKKKIEDKYILECVKVAIRSHKIGYELGLKHGSKKNKQELIEEIKKMRKYQYNSNKPEYKMTRRFIRELLDKLK